MSIMRFLGRAAAVVTAMVTAVLLTACSAAVDGTGHPVAAGGTAAFPTDPQALADLLVQGNTSISSAHLSFDETVGTIRITMSGDEKLNDGKVQAMDLTEQVPNVGTLRFVIVDGQLYAKLPPSLYPATKPWVKLDENTVDGRLRQLYTAFRTALQSGAGTTVAAFARAARNVRLKGTEQLDGTEVAHYALDVDVAALPTDFPNHDLLQSTGLSSIPVEIYVDHEGRTRRVTEDLDVSGQHVSSVVALTRIDQPVTITAPPASEVAPG
jgi:hypothetical protein